MPGISTRSAQAALKQWRPCTGCGLQGEYYQVDAIPNRRLGSRTGCPAENHNWHTGQESHLSVFPNPGSDVSW